MTVGPLNLEVELHQTGDGKYAGAFLFDTAKASSLQLRIVADGQQTANSNHTFTNQERFTGATKLTIAKH
jgi:hypothetical protein